MLLLLAVLCSACRSTSDGVVVRGETGARLDRMLTRMVPFGLSGSIVVGDRDGIVLSKGYGSRLTPRTIYDMGSITKSFTGTAILLLEADGKLSTNDTLGKHFPAAPPDKADIPLWQVLSHTAGLVDLTGGDYDDVSREQLIADAMQAPLVSKPGAEYHYSNAGFSLLAAIIEQVSGRSYHDFMRERLFALAGMHDTGYTVRANARGRVARTHTPPVDHGTPLERLERTGGVHWVLLGNGGMLTTTEDLWRWELALRRGEIVPDIVMRKMFSPLFRRPNDLTAAYAWSLQTIDGEQVIHHGSDGPPQGVNGEFRRYPDEQLAIIFLGNTRLNGWSPRRMVSRDVRRLMRGQSVNVPEVVAVDARELARYAGTYTLDDGAIIEVRVERDHLVAGAIGQSAVDLLTVQRTPESLASRRRLNAEAANLIPGATILGTSRRDRGAFMTTVRTAEGKVLRFAWSGGKPVAESDDEELPHEGVFSVSPIHYALERPLWRTRGDSFVFYDLYAGESIDVVFDENALQSGTSAAAKRR